MDILTVYSNLATPEPNLLSIAIEAGVRLLLRISSGRLCECLFSASSGHYYHWVPTQVGGNMHFAKSKNTSALPALTLAIMPTDVFACGIYFTPFRGIIIPLIYFIVGLGLSFFSLKINRRNGGSMWKWAFPISVIVLVFFSHQNFAHGDIFLCGLYLGEGPKAFAYFASLIALAVLIQEWRRS